MRKLDVDENAKGSEAANIDYMPTFKIYKNGAEVEKLEGADDRGLVNLLDRANSS